MKHIIVLALCIAGSLSMCHAQSFLEQSTDEQSPSPQLFRLNDGQKNHHIHAALPNNGTLDIDFLRLSDWGTRNDLYDIAKIAAAQAVMLRDSFLYAGSTKTLEVNIPMDKQVISVNYREDNSQKNQLAYKNNTYYQLKSGFDTIRVVKNVGIRTSPSRDSGLIQVQYTFILKELQDLQPLVENPDALNRTGETVDSFIAVKRRHWGNEDAYHHTLTLQYDADKPDKIKNARSPALFGKYVGIYLGFGAIVYENSISPYLEETIAYLVPSNGKIQGFVGLNVSVFGLLSNSSGLLNSTYYGAMNLEFGSCKKTTGLMQQKTSIAIGTLYSSVNDKRTYMFNMGFNYGINSFLSAGFNFASDFKKKTDNSFWGVHFKFNL